MRLRLNYEYPLKLLIITLLTVMFAINSCTGQPCLGCTEDELRNQVNPEILQVDKLSGITYFHIDTLGVIRLWEMYYTIVKNYSIWVKEEEAFNIFKDKLRGRLDLIEERQITNKNNYNVFIFHEYEVYCRKVEEYYLLLFLPKFKLN